MSSFLLTNGISISYGAEGDIESQIRTVYLSADFGASTYKSNLVLGNDTGNSIRYTLGAYVGAHKDVSIKIVRETAPITFVINSSSINSQWDDTIISYRLGYVSLGAVLESTRMETTKDSTPQFTATGTGYGVAFGFVAPLTRFTLLHLDATQAAISQLQEKDQKDVTFGPRLNIDAGATVDITKRALDFMFGYRYMKHTISYEGTSNAELKTTTYLGFCTGLDF